MQKNVFIPVGQLLKSVGTLGEMKLQVQDEYFEDIHRCGHFFIKKRGNYIPYFIQYFKEAADLIIKIEEIDSPESGTTLTLETLYLRQLDIQSEKGSSTAEKSQLDGYEVYNYGQKIGNIISVQQLQYQLLANVEYNGKEIMLPLHDALISHIDQSKNQIFMELPEGILDL